MSRRHPIAIVLLAVFATLAATPCVEGHAADKSFSTWELEDGRARVVFRTRLVELAGIPDGTTPEAYLAANLVLMTDDGPASASTPLRIDAPADWAIFRWTVECAGRQPHAIESRLFPEADATHLHFARLVGEAGDVTERVLSVREPTWPLETDVGRGSMLSYVGLGMHHILEGWDHLAFVLALLLLAGSLRELATLVTAFTIAHSVTLGLAATGLVRPAGAPVEIMIGFSIALIAAENCWLMGGRRRAIRTGFVALPLAATGVAAAGLGALGPLTWLGLALFSFCHFKLFEVASRPQVLRAIVAFVFGLVHGFGFAGVLLEAELPADRLLSALLGFNVGVELGQLLVVATVYPVLTAIGRISDGWRAIVAELGSATVFALGLYWAIVRTWG